MKGIDLADVQKIEEVLNSDPSVAEVEDTSVLTHTSLGICQLEKGWAVSVVKYNPLSGLAQVEAVNVIGPDRYYAEDEFKIQADKYNLI